MESDTKRRFAGRIPKRRLGTTETADETPPPVAPHRHSGIFIPPAPDSGIAVLRRRNENIRNPLTIADLDSDRMDNPPSRRTLRPPSRGDSGHFHPAQLHSSRTFNLPLARDENSGMTTGGRRRDSYRSQAALGNDRRKRLPQPFPRHLQLVGAWHFLP